MSVAGIAAQFTVTNGRSRRGAAIVDRAGDELLAGARLAEEEHRRVGRAPPARRSGAPPQRGATPEDLVEAVVRRELLPEVIASAVSAWIFRSASMRSSTFLRMRV